MSDKTYPRVVEAKALIWHPNVIDTWPSGDLRRAFIEGAKFGLYIEGSQMSVADFAEVIEVAETCYPNGRVSVQ